MWVEVGYVPVDRQSPAAVMWGAGDAALAVEGAVRPMPCIRTDFGEVVAGSAELFTGDGSAPFTGEIVVDSEVLAGAGETVSYRPAPGFDSGVDSFEYTIADGRGGLATAAVTARSRAPNQRA